MRLSILYQIHVGLSRAFGEYDFLDFFGNKRYARDCSKKIKAVFKSKGQSGKPLTTNISYSYKKSGTDKNLWEVDEEAAPVVRKIFRLCIDGY